jgi:glyoxylase-like metal-dependent hydrolase (beta-lactamase superfamily II)
VIIERLILTNAESNCYLVGCARTRQALVIDPGDDPARIQARLTALQLQPTLIAITHAHWDHLNAAGELATRSGAAVAIIRRILTFWRWRPKPPASAPAYAALSRRRSIARSRTATC